MSFEVFLSGDAERDIEEIYRYIAVQDGIARAEKVLGNLQDACAKLIDYPARGNVPKELRPLGIDEYREVHYKPYRVIYRITGRKVIVYCVVDGRRDMQTLLQRRLLR
jgi:toxin ParE1/3/4